MVLPLVHSAREVTALVRELGFLPFFECAVAGFSLKAATPPEKWFMEGVEGPWEWREQISSAGEVAYAKLFEKKAGFISREWLPDFVNYRRDGCDFDLFYDEGRATAREKAIVDALSEHGPMRVDRLKIAAGFGGEKRTEFDAALVRLQMHAYVVIQGFARKLDRYGQPYGWSAGHYALAEQAFGEELVVARYDTPPEESRQKIAARVRELFPDASGAQIDKLIRG